MGVLSDQKSPVRRSAIGCRLSGLNCRLIEGTRPHRLTFIQTSAGFNLEQESTSSSGAVAHYSEDVSV